jgi:hypothetical protein
MIAIIDLPRDRTPFASRSRFNWVHTLRVIDDKFLLHHQSIDAYLYLRFLRTIIFICFVGCCITWPILMPINATGGGKARQLDRIAIGNVAKNSRLYAHAVIAWVFFGQRISHPFESKHTYRLHRFHHVFGSQRTHMARRSTASVATRETQCRLSVI